MGIHSSAPREENVNSSKKSVILELQFSQEELLGRLWP